MCFFNIKLNILISGEQNFEILQYKPYIFQFVGLLATRKLPCVDNMFKLTLRFEVKGHNSTLNHPYVTFSEMTEMDQITGSLTYLDIWPVQ